MAKPSLDARGDVVLVDGRQMLVGEEREIGLERIVARGNPADFLTLPDDLALARQRESRIGGRRKPVGARRQLVDQHLRRRIPRGLAMHARRGGIRREGKAFELADIMLLDDDAAVLLDLGEQAVLVAHALHEHAGALIHKTLRELLVQRVGEPVLDLAGLGLPVIGVLEPFAPVRDKGPGADMGDAVRQRVDVALGVVRLLDLAREPILGDRALVAHDELVERAHQLGVGGWSDFPVIGNLADFPKLLDRGRCDGKLGDARIVGCEIQRFEIVRRPGALQTGVLGQAAQAFLQAVDAAEIEVCIAPLQNLDLLEVVVLKLVDEFLVEGLDIARDAESAVVEVAAGAARDLGKLGRGKAAVSAPVELAACRRRRCGRRRG